MTSSSPTAAARPSQVLVVDDDFTSRELLRIALKKRGWGVTVADGVPAAKAELCAQGLAAFDCVVTDFRMGELSGLDLLAWLQATKSCLATVILTAVGEKELVADSLRGGASDFLEKPVDLTLLLAAIETAVSRTHRQRQMAEMQSAMQDLGRTQAWMLRSQAEGAPVKFAICFHPRLEAGGDFFSHFKPGPDKYCCLLTDVSGHDLQAAYLSAFFQGVVSGMLECAVTLPVIFERFNRLLLQEWHRRSPTETGLSVAVCSVLLDFARQTADVITCGAPAPLYVQPGGRVEVICEQGGAPLGWFADFGEPAHICAVAPGGAFLMWTDGLEDLADKIEASALSAGFCLQQARRQGRKPADLELAADDILFVEVLLPDAPPESRRWHPLILERYHGGQAGEIDELEAHWSRCLQLAAPELGDRLRHDLLLAAREAVLNALNHGCGRAPGKSATLQISCDPAARVFRVWVDDPGCGHDFDLATHDKVTGTELVAGHRGLLLMRQLSQSLTLARHGAAICMDFGPEPVQP